MWPGLRPTSLPSGILIHPTVWPQYTNVTDRQDRTTVNQVCHWLFGSSVTAGHGWPPVTAGIGEWLDGVGQAGMYRTEEQMNGRTRLHRFWEGIPVNNCTMIEGVFVRIGSRGQDKMCRHQLNEWAWKNDEKVTWKCQSDCEDSCTWVISDCFSYRRHLITLSALLQCIAQAALKLVSTSSTLSW